MPHGVDVPYVFQTLDRSDASLSDGDWRISDAVATYWTNFAKRGDPNGAGLPEWPQFSEPDAKVMWFKNEPRLGTVPDAAGLGALDAYFAWRRSAEGSTWAK